MKGTVLEIGNVNIRIQGGNWSRRQAAHIAQLTFERVREAMAHRESGDRTRTIDRLATRPVLTAREAGPEEIARAAAVEICRALRES